MNSTETLNKVRTLLGLDVKLEDRLLENGTRLVAEQFAAGNEVFIMAEDDEKIPLPKGEYTLEDGQRVVVLEDGLIDEVKEAVKKEVTEEEEVVEEEMAEDDEAAVDDWAGMEKRIKNLEDAVADLKSRVGEDEKEIEEELQVDSPTPKSRTVKEEFTAKTLKHNPEAKDKVNMTQVGKVSGTRQRVFDRIFNN